MQPEEELMSSFGQMLARIEATWQEQAEEIRRFLEYLQGLRCGRRQEVRSHRSRRRCGSPSPRSRRSCGPPSHRSRRSCRRPLLPGTHRWRADPGSPSPCPDQSQLPVPLSPHVPVPQSPHVPVPQSPLLLVPVPQSPLLQSPVPQNPHVPVPQSPLLLCPVPQSPLLLFPVPQSPRLPSPVPVPQSPFSAQALVGGRGSRLGRVEPRPKSNVGDMWQLPMLLV
ncbi:hypothetical protein EYF80_064215 [Liparis tanakae]|uniref:Uncharacterized protein n=1 Tax=Liparis tanakae TaxID=230148 RepID=A0A4Z2EAT3_9TELE|nr:hypothetical protein EYF80_064215 [Liparis tanakae]